MTTPASTNKKTFGGALAAALMLASMGAFAQASNPAATMPAPPASSVAPVAPGIKPGPRLLSPNEKRESEAQPQDLRPERQVTPQLSIPFGKKPMDPAPKRSTQPRAPAAAPVGVEDSAARCEAEADDATRAICRDKRAKAGKKALPV